MPMKGSRAHINRLKRLSGPTFEREIGKALFVAGDLIAREAQISITTGSQSGANHVPSLPFTPPNNDTGVLANNIENLLINPQLVEVSSNAPYASALELGTSKMSARPYMKPARDKMRPQAVALVERAVAKLVRSSRGA